jgi:hypothetical protein
MAGIASGSIGRPSIGSSLSIFEAGKTMHGAIKASKVVVDVKA